MLRTNHLFSKILSYNKTFMSLIEILSSLIESKYFGITWYLASRVNQKTSNFRENGSFLRKKKYVVNIKRNYFLSDCCFFFLGIIISFFCLWKKRREDLNIVLFLVIKFQIWFFSFFLSVIYWGRGFENQNFDFFFQK